MKKLLKTILPITVLFAFCGIMQGKCQNNNEKEIIGTWQMDQKAVLKEMKAADKEKIEKMNMGRKTALESSLASRVFTFSADGFFGARWMARGNHHQVVGKWRISDKTLSTEINGERKEYIIESLTINRLVLLPMGKQRGMLNKLIFIKTPEK